jgi:hypothetical protein
MLGTAEMKDDGRFMVPTKGALFLLRVGGHKLGMPSLRVDFR